MFGFDSGLPIAPTGEFPGFVNPTEPVRGESDLLLIGGGDDAPRRGRRPGRPDHLQLVEPVE
jgi:hypothetical protein